LNWYNIASIYTAIAADLRENISGFGFISGGFLLGIGLFQIPGGLLAARAGPKRTAAIGTTISSAASTLCGFAGDLQQLIVLRFLVGLGMALVFAPGVTLMTRYFRHGSEGLGVGLFNAAFSLGGAVGLLGWALLAELIGWRVSLILGGALGLVTGLMLLLAVPSDPAKSDFTIHMTDVRAVLSNTRLFILGIGLLGFGIGYQLVSNFVVLYLQYRYGITSVLAGVVGGLVLIVSVPTAPFAGRLYDRMGNQRKLILLFGLVLALGVALPAIEFPYSTVIAALMAGVGGGAGLTIGFTAARQANPVGELYETLSVSWANSLSLYGGFWSPVLFSTITLSSGYPIAWLIGSLYTLLLFVPVAIFRATAIRPS
jgi:MFS family permease